MGQYSEDGSLRSQARPRILGEYMAGTIYSLNRDLVHLKSGRGSDDRSVWTLCPSWPLLEVGVDHEAMGGFPGWEL